MFDIGFSELLVIAVVALLVLGPERLPKAARFAGLWVRKARAQWYSVKSEFEREMAADEMKRSLGNPVQDLRREVESAGQALSDSVREAQAQARADGDAATAVQDLPPAAQEAPATDPPAAAEPPPFELTPDDTSSAASSRPSRTELPP
jgi:sec-independent protein translocase protein TatB